MLLFLFALIPAAVFLWLWLATRWKANAIADELVENREKTQALLKAFPDGVIILDLKGTILYVSDAFLGFHKSSGANANVGASVFDCLPPSLHEVGRDCLRGFYEGKDVGIPSHEIEGTDGNKYWVHVRGAAVRDREGVARSYVLLVRDVTKRRKAEQELEQYTIKLQEANERIAKLQKGFLNICAWTKKVNVDGTWVPVDEYLERYLGIKLTHGISDEGIAILEKQAGIPLKKLASGEDTAK